MWRNVRGQSVQHVHSLLRTQKLPGGGGMNGVYACVCVIVCSGQCRSLSSDKQVLCHMVKMTRKDMRDSLLVVKHNLFFAFHKKVQNK